MDRRTALLQEFWRKAHTTPSGIAIPQKTKAMANKLRFDLYNCVKKIKDDPTLDPALFEAVSNVMISYDSDRTTLLMKLKAPDADLLAVAAGLGIDVSALTTAPEDELEREARESAERVGAAPGVAPIAGKNKYFDREE